MKVEVFHFDECPNVTPTVERLKRILAENGLSDPITLVRVGDHAAAQSTRFLGSPTVRIDGLDIEPSARSRSDFGIICRTYGASGVPSETIIRRAIAEASNGSQ